MRTANSLSVPNLIFNEIKSIKIKAVKNLLMVFTLAALVLFLVAMISSVYHVPFYKLTSDPAAIGGIPPLFGALSNLGVILWCAAATSCALAAMTLRNLGTKKLYLYLFYSFLLSSFLLFDDLFQFHEDLSVSIGLNQKVIYVLLGIAIVAYLVYFRKILLQTNFIPFLIGLSFLGLSILADTIIYKIFGGQLGDWLYFLEDGAKWIGIVFWSYYFITTSFQFIIKSRMLLNTDK